MNNISDKEQHDNNFDLVRLLAALAVAVGHILFWLDLFYLPLLKQLLQCFPGVAVFFVTSGFLVTSSWTRGDYELRRYLTRRALRIYPALWLQYFCVIVLMFCTGGFFLSTLMQPQFWQWLATASIAGSNFWAGALLNYSPFNWDGLYKGYPADVLWTIPVELGFYLLVPILFLKVLRNNAWGGVVLFTAFVASVLLAYRAGPMLKDHGNLNSTGMLHSSPFPYLWIFLCGAAAARYWSKISFLFVDRALMWLALVAAAAALNWKFFGTAALTYRTPDALTVPRTILLAGFVLSFAHSWTWLSKWLRGIDLSYGLYLFHLPLPFGLYFAGKTGDPKLALFSLFIAFALAATSWFFVEKPMLMLKRKIR